MKFKQLLIPIMAMVFAVGMSFTTEESTATVWMKDANGDALEVNATDCGVGNDECVGQIGGVGTEYELFHDQELNNPIFGAGIAVIITP